MRAQLSRIFLLALLALAGCGGGGDAPPPSDDQVPPPAPVRCAVNPALCR